MNDHREMLRRYGQVLWMKILSASSFILKLPPSAPRQRTLVQP